MRELHQLGVGALQREMESGGVTARRVVDHCLERIESIDRRGPSLNSILEINPDAQGIADCFDRERAEGRIRSALHGIPVVLKANIDTCDRMATTAGSLALAGSIAMHDAFVVRRLREAGAVILAKANLSEWANFRGARSVSGWSSLGGQTRNPYDTNRSPCGSSSGSAVAVAAGLTPLAVGTETDGSIICPAQTCGVVGIKPTLGLISRSGMVPIAHSQDTAGSMAATVEDAALLLTAMAGADARDPATTAIPEGLSCDLVDSLDADALGGARIGVARDFFGKHPKVDALIELQLEVLADLGADLIDPAPLETAGQWRDTELSVLLYEFKHDLDLYLQSLGADAPVRSLAEIIEFNKAHAEDVMPHFGQELLEQAVEKRGLNDEEYTSALTANHRLAREQGIDATMIKHGLDALVAPSGAPAWRIDHVLGDLHLGGCSSPAAVAGYPHITVPAGQIADLPVGLSFFGAAWQDAKLIRFAYSYEQATRARCAPSLP